MTIRFRLAILAAAAALGSCVAPYPETKPAADRVASAPRSPAPVAIRSPRVTEVHGVRFVDEYAWLRDRDNPAVLRHLADENTYTNDTMRHTARLQAELYTEMLGRIKQTDLSVPVRRGPYEYYTRTEEGKAYPIQCRRRAGGGPTESAPEELLLDQNALAAQMSGAPGGGGGYLAVANFTVSPDHNWLAYAVDITGAERYTLRFRDLATGADLKDAVPDTTYGLAWASDNATVFYLTQDEANRADKVWRHRVGTDASQDALVYEEKDPAFYASVSRTRSGQFLLMSLGSMASTEVRFLSAADPTGEFRVIAPRRPKVEYGVEHQGDWFYIVTNEDAVNFRLLRAPASNPERASWEEVIPHDPRVMIAGVEGFAGHLVVEKRELGVPTLHVRALGGGSGGGGDHAVVFPETVYSVSLTGNAEYDTPTLRFRYTSLVTPPSIFDYDMNTRERTLRKEQEVLGGYDRTKYVTGRIEADAPDGTRVPISIVYREGLSRDGRNPTLLRGYGAYGVPLDPEFSAADLSLLDRGFVVATAHVRGGGELGRPWYEGGRLKHKPNSFTDFIACAERLIDAGYTSPDRLAIEGGSAGGLLVGAATTMRPDLFKAVIADVPFVDVLNSMLDSSLPLTVVEYDQWGNPNERDWFDLIRSYAPYENVAPRAYPDVLILAGLNDPRVPYWEPAKWSARLRANNTGPGVVLLKTNMGAGHGGASDRYEAIREEAFKFAFLLDRLGVSEN